MQMLLAEGSSLDGLIKLVQLMMLSTALPGICGLFLFRLGGGATVMAFGLGVLSALAGVGCLGWVSWERSTVPDFYVAAGTPLLVGLGTCVLAGRVLKRRGPPA